MDDEPAAPPLVHRMGDDLSRLSVRELEALREACLQEVDRISAAIRDKNATRAAADGVFRL